jgi:excisionase family DNA binding protein
MNASKSPLLLPSEVAAMFGVDPKTVARWARAGRLHPIRTLGGHRRFDANEVGRVMEQHTDESRWPASTFAP